MSATHPRILLVDDEPQILAALGAVIRRAMPEVSVDMARDAAEAMALVGRHEYDLTVSDYRMPGEDGIAFLEHVRAKRPTTVRILLTAYPEQDAAIRGINDARVDRFLTKPISTAAFVEALRGALDERRADANRAAAFARGLNALNEELRRARQGPPA
ncbi:MAG: hypothetical protein QOE90_779 [Thermoplasmata archaeon]|jgi:DNA-binding NtrC family response regulator|nr:hypothetical protein [Thermoplasmata archaeon]